MQTSTKQKYPTRLRSFVRRDSRLTTAQEKAFTQLMNVYGLTLEDGLLAKEKVFGNSHPLYLEIGFGSGTSLLELARIQPQINFIGVETHKPGIGTVFKNIQEHSLVNLRVYYGDVIDVLTKCISSSSLDGIQIFFPDPWPKRRHHPRRLIQSNFITQLIEKLKPDGVLYLATDWEDYAIHMMRVLSKENALINAAGINQFAKRSPHRPIITKFEARAIREGRCIWDLHFKRNQ